jgi:putative IMPACT (imprinted ancient) family translation regulator
MKIFENIISDRGSKYAVSGGLVTSRNEIAFKIKLLKENKKFSKATHNSWAVLFPNSGPVKSDDGEAGAGMMIVRMLERKELNNHLIIVSRWFGGVHLGGDRYRRIRDCVNYYLENYDK